MSFGGRGETERPRHMVPRSPEELLADAELLDDRPIPFHVDFLQVVEKAAPAANHLEQAATAVVILRVGLEMLGHVGDSVREECDLHFWRSGIALVSAILSYDFCFLFLRRRQNKFSFTRG